MAEHVMAPGDVEVAGEGRVEVLREKKSSTGWVWRVSGALLCAALCVGAVRIFDWYWRGRPEVTVEDEHHNRTEAKAAENITDLSPPPQYDESNFRPGSLISRHKAAIHLVPMNVEKLEWTNALSYGFSQGGLTLENNAIVIPRRGAYFVYSLASFMPSCGSQPSQLIYSIMLLSTSYSEPVVLMKSVKTACTAGGGVDSSYLGAVFLLWQGDRLFVEAKHFVWVGMNPDSTFFGVFEV